MAILHFLITPVIAMAAGDFQSVIKSHSSEIRQCYSEALKANPRLQGKIELQWSIDDKGKAKDVLLNKRRSTIKEPAMIECVVAKIVSLHFPPAPSGMTTDVRHPFVFNKTAQ